MYAIRSYYVGKIDDPSRIGVMLASSVTCILYSLFGIIFLLPVKARLKAMLLLTQDKA